MTNKDLFAAAESFSDKSLMQISETEFNRIKDILYARAGIALTPQKRALVVGRLQNKVKGHGFVNFSQYIDFLEKDSSGAAISELIDSMSTNHTHFYREKSHFEYFASKALPQILADLHKNNEKDLRLWCAATATGEEPYTILIHIIEALGLEYSKFDAGILATDISNKALQIAKTGTYAADKFAEVPSHILQKYFVKNPDGSYTVSERLKKEVIFRRFNLMNETFPFNKKFHAIFCRNVMIYFDQPTRAALIEKMHNCLVPGGYFFIGHSESLGAENTLFDYIMPAAYRRKM